MSHAVTTEAAPTFHATMPSAVRASEFSPTQMREAIAYWVGQDRLDMANALLSAGLGLYPRSQDVLAIGALLSEVNEDWSQAQSLVERLIEVQGEEATAESWYHLVRIMRVRGAFYGALRAAQQALTRHPAHAGLVELHAQLAELLASADVQVQAQADIA